MAAPSATAPVIGTTATVLANPGPSRVVKVSNPAATVTVYVGPSTGLSFSTGYPVATGTSDSFVVEDGATLYALVRTTTTTVNVYVSVS